MSAAQSSTGFWRDGEKIPGHTLIRWTEGHAVHVVGEEAHRTGKVLEHGESKLRVAPENLVQSLTVDGNYLAFSHGHSGGHTGTAIEKSGLAHQIPRAMGGEHPLISRL